MSIDICYESDLRELGPTDIEVCYGPFDDIDKLDSYGDTLLLASCKIKSLENVSYYLMKGADPDYINDCGESPLLEIVDTAEDNEEVSLQILRVLIGAGANLEVRGYMDKTPFLKACSRKSLKVLKLLVESGSNTKAVVSEYGSNLDGLWFADCFNLSKELQEYIRNAVNS